MDNKVVTFVILGAFGMETPITAPLRVVHGGLRMLSSRSLTPWPC
jgi:hypothetical protein